MKAGEGGTVGVLCQAAIYYTLCMFKGERAFSKTEPKFYL